MEEAADKPIYKWTHHIVSGHTLKHLCAAMVPVFLALMLAKRSIEAERYFFSFAFTLFDFLLSALGIECNLYILGGAFQECLHVFLHFNYRKHKFVVE